MNKSASSSASITNSRRASASPTGALMNEAAGETDSSKKDWIVYRIDDNGNVFAVQRNLSREEAECLVAEFEARGHKQMYWAESRAE